MFAETIAIYAIIFYDETGIGFSHYTVLSQGLGVLWREVAILPWSVGVACGR